MTPPDLVVAAHAVLDAQLRLARPLGRVGAELAVGVENLTGAAYAVIEGYPMPPRHGRLTLRLHLR